MSVNEFDMEKARQLREKIKEPFMRKLRKNFVVTMVATVPLMILFVYVTARWALSSWTAEAPPMYYAMLYCFLIMYTMLMWTSYSVGAQFLLVLKEIKQLRLDFLASDETPVESATGGAESFNPAWPVMAMPKRQIALLSAVVFVMIPLAASFVYTRIHDYRRIHWADYEQYGGQEMLDVHLAADGLARAVSRISITKCPSLVATLPIQITQPNATLESITIDGRPIPYDPVPGQPNTFNIMPGLPEKALRNALLEVTWSFPPKGINNVQLKGLIPVNSYALNAVIDPGSPYKFLDHPDRKTFNLFWTKTTDGTYRGTSMGTAGIGIEPAQTGK